MPTEVRNEIPPGTLDMLILRTVAQGGPMHGFHIADTIQQRTEDVLRVEEGSLYPALQRMLIQGWLAGEWGKTPENRRARYYKLTAAGRKHLEREISRYQVVSRAIGRVLRPVEEA